MSSYFASVINSSNDFTKFSCGDADLDDFIKNEALGYHEQKYASTYVWRTSDLVPIAFFPLRWIVSKRRKSMIMTHLKSKIFPVTKLPD